VNSMSSYDAVEMLGVVAKVLENLSQQVVFTGGATIPLYLDAYAAAEMRSTDDVDCVVEIVSQASYYRLAKKLRELGLSEDSSKGARNVVRGDRSTCWLVSDRYHWQWVVGRIIVNFRYGGCKLIAVR
jgi:hypothetical protein